MNFYSAMARAETAASQQPEQAKSWKRVQAVPNASRLMVGDRDELDPTGMQVNVQIDGFRARVLIDYFYHNDRDQQLEGNFKLRLPDDSSLYYFAFGESAYALSSQGKLAGDEFIPESTQCVSLQADRIVVDRKGKWDNVKQARMVPREKAAHAFRETVRQRVDPALVQWAGAGVFSARVFPLAPKKLHRIVVGYDANLKQTPDGLVYELTLPQRSGDCKIELNVRWETGGKHQLIGVDAPSVRVGDWDRYRCDANSIDESKTLELHIASSNPNPALLQSASDSEKYWATPIRPNIESEPQAGSSRAIFLVDTSLSSSPEKFNLWLELLQQNLNNNRQTTREFAVLFFGVDSKFWKPAWTANTSESVAKLRRTIQSIALEGATDLYQAIETIAAADWVTESDDAPDVFLLSDGAATWGETNLRLIDRRYQQSGLGNLFAYQTGLTGTAMGALRFLAGQTGGAVFSVTSDQEVAAASTAHRQRPWRLSSISSGATDVLTAGRVQWVYPRQRLVVVGRGQVTSPIGANWKTIAIWNGRFSRHDAMEPGPDGR